MMRDIIIISGGYIGDGVREILLLVVVNRDGVREIIILCGGI